MALKLTRLELQIMEALWTRSPLSIREIQEAFPKDDTPAYTTVQTTVYRLEGKKALRRVRKISNAHIFEPVVARNTALLVDDFLGLFGGRTQPVMAQLIESGKLTLDECSRRRRVCASWRRRGDRNDPCIHESLVAIDAVRAAGGTGHAGAARESCADAVPGMDGGLGQIFRVVLGPGDARGALELAYRSRGRRASNGARDRVDRATLVAPVAAARVVKGTTIDPVPIIGLVWGCGVLVVLCHWLARWRSVRAVVRLASPFDLDFPVAVRTSNSLIEPGVFGILWPVLLLPAGIVERLTRLSSHD
jgi:BlaI family transcriptional regulator, penicillinase repressor